MCACRVVFARHPRTPSRRRTTAPSRQPAPARSQNVWGHHLELFQRPRAHHGHECVHARPLLGLTACTPSHRRFIISKRPPTPAPSQNTRGILLNESQPSPTLSAYERMRTHTFCVFLPINPWHRPRACGKAPLVLPMSWNSRPGTPPPSPTAH